MGIEDVLLKYLENPTIESLLAIIIIAFFIGILSLSYRFFVKEGGNASWSNLNFLDKFFISFLVGILSLFISFGTLFITVAMAAIIETVFLINLGFFLAEDSSIGVIAIPILIILGMFYPMHEASKISKKDKGLEFLSKLFSARTMLSYIPIAVPTIFMAFGLFLSNWNSFFIGLSTFFIFGMIYKYVLNKK